MNVTNNSTNMSKHVALQGAHVHENALYVTFGAPPGRTQFLCLCTSWTDLWASIPPMPSNDGRTCQPSGLLGAQPPPKCHPDLTPACPRLRPSLRFVIPSVGGGAMHMKWPDGIGLEAGNGRTQDREELTIVRACPWRLIFRRVTPRRSKRAGSL